jgi:hypothetical protein
LEPEAAKPSIPEENVLVDNNNTKQSIKSLSNADNKFRKRVIITKCLCEPCPRFYTDTISESIIIECKNSKHICDGGEQ